MPVCLGQEVVRGEQTCDAREVGKARVRRQAQDDKDAGHGERVEDAAAEHGVGKLRENALVTCLVLRHRGDVERAAKHRDADQEKPQERHDPTQGVLGPRCAFGPEIGHPVAHSLDARHRGASACVRAQQQPRRRSNHGCDRDRGRDDGFGVPAMHRGADEPEHDNGQKPDDEQIGGHREEPPARADAAQVDDQHDQQHPQAHRQREWRQRWQGRDDRTDAGRDPHGDVQHVVEAERRRCDQAGVLAEVLLRDRVRAPAARVSVDRLTVRQEHGRQQHDDRQRERHHCTEPDKSEPQ
jgi:hypothetical protein